MAKKQLLKPEENRAKLCSAKNAACPIVA